uniref:KIB1-4 beta-propeller domain-containing protein n=1 Tax=Setaria italica TaxID=4555 RepID=A0A0Q3T1F7_SETIT
AVVCPDGLIAAIVGRKYFAKVALCLLDTFSWLLSTHDRWRWYEDIAFANGKVYALTGDEDLLAFDVGIDVSIGNLVVSHVKRVIQSWLPCLASAKVRYLVRSRGGALLMVRRHFLPGETTVRFSVFRADLRSSHWVEVSTLGGDGEALFMGRPCSRAVCARGVVRGDQIFFLQDEGVLLFADHRRDGLGEGRRCGARGEARPGGGRRAAVWSKERRGGEEREGR